MSVLSWNSAAIPSEPSRVAPLSWSMLMRLWSASLTACSSYEGVRMLGDQRRGFLLTTVAP